MSKRFYYDEFCEEIFDEEIQTYPSNQSICGILNKQAQRIAELEEQLQECIRPKFKIGQEVFYVVDKYSPVLSGEVLEIQIWDLKKDNIVYVIEYGGNVWCESNVFATKAEALAKLEELGEKR